MTEISELKQDRANIQRSLGRIEGKLDALVVTLAAHTADDKTNFITIEKQMDGVQRMVWMSIGVISFLGVAIPVAVAYLK